MEDNYEIAPGTLINIEEIKNDKVVATFRAIQEEPFHKFIECRKRDDSEIIVYETMLSISQKTIFDVRVKERIAIKFRNDDSSNPEVLILRKDFPRVPHVYALKDTTYTSICLYEESYEEIKLNWTAINFLKRIRTWLENTSQNQVHLEDQPLEPLLLPSERIVILPSKILEYPLLKFAKRDDRVLKAKVYDGSKSSLNNLYQVVSIVLPAQTHGVITRPPANLFELSQYLQNIKYDLIDYLRKCFKEIMCIEPVETRLKCYFALMIALPVKRDDETPEDDFNCEWWFFISTDTYQQVGIEIGVYEAFENSTSLLMKANEEKKGEEIKLEYLNPVFAFNRKIANALGNIKLSYNPQIVLIGAGALGSQIVNNYARIGYGNWTIIDSDIFLPHNISRHLLTGKDVGLSKAKTVSQLVNTFLDDSVPFSTYLDEDILNQDGESSLLQKLVGANVIIDASTSIPVARYISNDVITEARRISVFLNPNGNDLVILAEDIERHTTLDCIECQYYREIVNSKIFEKHLFIETEKIRYARSCRDISARIPQYYVALHSALATKKIKEIIDDSNPHIFIAHYDYDNDKVDSVDLVPSAMIIINKDDWRIITDEILIDKLFGIRREKLPNETGGILIGFYDMSRKIVYVSDIITSPEDSIEWPSGYIRGHHELESKVNIIKQKTQDRLIYIGEWHTHPGKIVSPSSADTNLLSWIWDIFKKDGLPALMLIIGEDSYNFILKVE